jgi:hypothetical protein
MPQTEEEKQYHKTYYKQNRDVIIARQMEYHREHREKYLGYMREYNKQYYLKNHVPKPKKIKAPKEPKPPKPPKEIKTKKVKEIPLDAPKDPIYPTRIQRGNFVLNFFD